MREYAKVAPGFWTGDSGRKIRAAGPEALVVALYLVTGPHANMIGLYYLPVPFIAHETGLPAERVTAALSQLERIGFVRRDDAREMVWVCEMARFQVAERLKPADKRVAGIRALLERIPATPLRDGFVARYRQAFHLSPHSPRQTETASHHQSRGKQHDSRSLVARNRAALQRQTDEPPRHPVN